MPEDRQGAGADFRRMIKLAVVAAVIMVAAAIAYLMATGDLTRDMVIATALGVFLSVMLGAGLMAASYFSAKSGHDRSVSDATRGNDAG